MNLTTINPFCLCPCPFTTCHEEEESSSTLSEGLAAYWCSGTETNLPTEWDEAINFVLQLSPVGTPAEGASGTGKFVDKAVIFDGAGSIPNQTSLVRADEAALRISDDVTFAAWIYPDNVAGNKTILAKKDGTHSELLLNLVGANLTFNGILPNGRAYNYAHTTPVAAAEWTLVLLDYDHAGDTIGLSINGVEERDPSISGGSYTAGASFRIGLQGLLYQPFVGRMNHVARWDRLLTNDEKAELLTDSLANLIAGGSPAGVTTDEGTITTDEGTLTTDES